MGESTKLTYSLGAATWSSSASGSLSSGSGTDVTYTAPDRATTVTITATGGGCSATITLTVVEPSDIRIVRKPGTRGRHTHGSASVGFIGDVFFLPADVSFENCSWLEDEVDAVGNGCFQSFYATHHIGHHPNPSPIPVGPPDNDTSGSKVRGFDRISGSGSACNGGWTWAIPTRFQVGSGTTKVFTTVNEVVTITAAGATDISKGGESNHSNKNDATEIDPLF